MKRRKARLMRSRLGQALIAPNLRFRVRRYELGIPGWGARSPLRIGILSDLHWGYRPVTAPFVGAVKRRLLALEPDMIVFLGDLAEGANPSRKFKNVVAGAEALAGLEAPLGCYAVLGNHDWHDDPEAQVRRSGPIAAAAELEAAGFTVLQNRSVRPGRQDVWLAGLDSQQAFKGRNDERRRMGADDLSGTMVGVEGDDPVILLAHEPDIFPEIADPRVVLTLSGHMHGGQIRPLGRAIYAPSRHGTRYDYGHFRQDGHQLVVSGGLGCSTLPLRIGITPEITLVECRAE